MKRREFITLLGGATAWPVTAHAEGPAIPVIGFLSAGSSDTFARFVAAFRQGLKERGYVEGRNVAIEYRWAEGQYDRFSELAVDLVRVGVSVIAAITPAAAIAAHSTTKTIPIVFNVASNPIELGLVASFNRPGGNATGVNFLINELVAKQFAFLHEVVPKASVIGFLVNPIDRNVAEPTTKDVQVAADALRHKLVVVRASSEREFDAAFAGLIEQHAEGLVIGPDALYNSQRNRLVALAAQHRLPTAYSLREFPAAGGLMSYGTSLTDAFRLVGVYIGRILKGEKPADLPVVQPTKYELVINLATARALGLSVPPTLLALADEVIE
jgi:putative tryptophan/tyrosine transport system substrate-binding protein